jgi:MOSC domain-containing protein YiiM
MTGVVTAVCLSGAHTMSKLKASSIKLLKGLGVDGDAHQGETVKHRSRAAKDPTQPNLRQVHLIHAELRDELREKGFDIREGQMGENITTRGLELLTLPKGTKLYIGQTTVVEVTGLRNPCLQLDRLQQGLMAAVLDKDAGGNLIRKAGIMAVVLESGEIFPDDIIRVGLPAEPHQALQVV